MDDISEYIYTDDIETVSGEWVYSNEPDLRPVAGLMRIGQR